MMEKTTDMHCCFVSFPLKICYWPCCDYRLQKINAAHLQHSNLTVSVIDHTMYISSNFTMACTYDNLTNMAKSHLEVGKLINYKSLDSSKCLGVCSLSVESEQMHTSISSLVELTRSTVNHGAVLQQ